MCKLLLFNKNAILSFCSLFFFQAFHAQITNKEIVAKIVTTKVDEDFIKIDAKANSNTDIVYSLRYIMSVIKTNPETLNSNKNEQSGRFVLQSYQEKILSTTTINQNIKDKVTVLLLVYDTNDNLVAKDRLVVLNDNKIKKQPKVNPPKEDDYVGLRGIVTENTKTKPGHDFYRLFYSNYTLKKINGKRIVKVNEKISLGRNTVIEVKIDNTIVHQFFVRPTRDFLIKESERAIYRVSKFFINLEKQKAYIKNY